MVLTQEKWKKLIERESSEIHVRNCSFELSDELLTENKSIKFLKFENCTLNNWWVVLSCLTSLRAVEFNTCIIDKVPESIKYSSLGELSFYNTKIEEFQYRLDINDDIERVEIEGSEIGIFPKGFKLREWVQTLLVIDTKIHNYNQEEMIALTQEFGRKD